MKIHENSTEMGLMMRSNEAWPMTMAVNMMIILMIMPDMYSMRP